MITLDKKTEWKLHEDDEWFDEIRLETQDGCFMKAVTKPRYKTSGLSGNEWRTSVHWQINIDGQWMYLENSTCRDLKVACAEIFPMVFSSLPQYHRKLIQCVGFYRKGKKLYESTYEGNTAALLFLLGHLPWALIHAREDCGCRSGLEDFHEYCFQPGCNEKAVSTYQLRFEYCREGHKSRQKFWLNQRRFCQRHLQRGNCGLEDANENYIVISGPGPDQAKGYDDDINESQFGGIFEVKIL